MGGWVGGAIERPGIAAAAPALVPIRSRRRTRLTAAAVAVLAGESLPSPAKPAAGDAG